MKNFIEYIYEET